MKIHKKDIKNADLLCFEMFKDAVLTEKSVNMEMKENCMTFLVHKNITKNHVRIGIEEFFKTKVISVRVINTKSKKKYFRGRKETFTPTHKKIMVRVSEINKVQEALNG